MSIKVTCPACEASYSVADEKRGKKIRCKECEEAFQVPKGKGDDTEDKVMDRKGKPPVKAATRYRDDDDDEGDDEEEQPKSKKKKQKQKEGGGVSPMLLIGGGVGLVAIVGVVLFLVMGGSDDAPVARKDPPPPPPQAAPVVPANNPVREKEKETAPKDPTPQPIKKAPEVEVPVNTTTVGTLSGERVYEELLKSTVWIIAKQNGPGGTTPTPTPGGTDMLAGSTWSGSETLQGYGALQFQFLPNKQAVMVDKDGRTPGSYTINGNSVTLTFGGGVTYMGNINGNTMNGSANNGKANWTWTVTRQGGGAAVNPPAAKNALAGSVYVGQELNFPVQFQFPNGNQVIVMSNRNGQHKGTFTLNGTAVTMTFAGGLTYRGNLVGATLQGQGSRPGPKGGNWLFVAQRQGGAPPAIGQQPMGFNPGFPQQAVNPPPAQPFNPPPQPVNAGFPAGEGLPVDIQGDLYTFLQAAVKDKRLVDVNETGFKLGNNVYRDCPDEGAVLTGFQIGYGMFVNNQIINAMRPIYLTKNGEKMGAWQGTPPANPATVKAKPGYAVGSVSIRTGLGIDRLSVTFMKLQKNRLQMEENYNSQWMGGQGGQSLNMIGGKGSFFVGVFGHLNNKGEPCSLGLIAPVKAAFGASRNRIFDFELAQKFKPPFPRPPSLKPPAFKGPKTPIIIILPPGFDPGAPKVPLGPAVFEGTGSLVDRKHRLILTNCHVVGSNPSSVTIHFPGSDKDGELISNPNIYAKQPGFNGKVVMREEKADLALVQLDSLPDGVVPLSMAKKSPRPASQVHSMGNPGASNALWIYSPGKVRAVYHDKWKIYDDYDRRDVFYDAMKIETDSAINSGDSGGPLVNDRCVLVGVAHGHAVRASNISAFIDVSECRKLMEKYYKSIGETWVPIPPPALPMDIASPGSRPADVAKVPDLIKKLASADFGERLQAVQTLGNMGPGATVAFEKLFQAMKDKDAVVRRAAEDAVGKVPPHKADVPMLCQACEDTDEPMEVRLMAVKSMARLGGEAKSALPVLIQQLKDSEQALRLQAFSAIIAIGPEAKEVPVLIESLKKAEPQIQRLAAEALLKMGPQAKDAVLALAESLKHPEPELRRLAGEALIKMGELAKPAIPVLAQNLKNPDKAVRLASIRILEGIGADAKEAIPALTEALKDTEPEIGVTAALALIKAGDPKATMPFLQESLKKTTGEVRKKTARGLVLLGSDALPALSDLIAALNDDLVRPDATEALVKIGRPACDSIAKKATLIINAKARLACIEALGRIGHATPKVVAQLQQLYRVDPVDENRQAAFRALERLQGKN